MSTIQITPDPEQLASAAAEHFIRLAQDAIQTRSHFSVALAGGSTPQAMFKILASSRNANRLDWSKIYVFWGDERCVPPDHTASNYRLARAALLDHVPILPENIQRMPGELEPITAANQYERLLRKHFLGNAKFDLILLGMGTDGHTASLFPGMAAIHELNRWVIAHYVEKLASWRITLTPVILNQARQITFLVSGNSKAKVLSQVLHGEYQPAVLPSQIIHPSDGNLTWLLDRDAAARLPRGPG